MNEISKLNQTRVQAASTNFDGKIVRGFEFSKTVEIYDHITNAWSYIPNMIEVRSSNNLVAIKNKMFVLGRYDNCEMFYKLTNKFTIIEIPVKITTPFNYRATSIEKKLSLE